MRDSRIGFDPPDCYNGWSGCREVYTGGHYCVRHGGHSGRCRCPCGATTTIHREGQNDGD